MRAGLLARFLVFLALGLLPSLLSAQDRLEVVKVVLAELRIRPGAEQLVQVSLRNPSSRAVAAGLHIELRAGRNRPTKFSRRRTVTIPAATDRRVFFRLKAPRRPGKYSVRLVVFKPNFKTHLLTGKPEFFSSFTVIAPPPPRPGDAAPPVAGARNSTAAQQAVAKRNPGFKPGAGLKFDKADLLWESFTVKPAKLLTGLPLEIKAELRNVGGDIARDFQVRLISFNTRLPKRIANISVSQVDVLAPGEKLELEFEYRFPPDALLGQYEFVLFADQKQQVKESNERNNKEVTDPPILLSNILLTFPEAGFMFDQAGLFLFRWDSAKFNEFKVQVGTDPRFEKKESFFDLPQGDKWTQAMEIVPLAGELPGMLLGLMIRDDADTAYWRVVGKVAGTDKVGFSRASPFKLQADLPGPADQGDGQAKGQAGQKPANRY